MTISASIEQADKPSPNQEDTSTAAVGDASTATTVSNDVPGIPGVDAPENKDSTPAAADTSATSKPEDNESLIVHVEESALAEIDAELTSTPKKSDEKSGEEGVDSNKLAESDKEGKEKWESESPEKSGGDKDGTKKDGEKKTDDKTGDGKSSAKDSSSEKKSPSSATSRSKRFVT